MVLPLMKLRTLLVKTISKPLASQLKHQAKVHPRFRQSIINFAQRNHRITMQIQRRIYGHVTDVEILLFPYIFLINFAFLDCVCAVMRRFYACIRYGMFSCGKAEGLIGGTTIRLVNSKMLMKSGTQKLRLWQGKEADGSFSTSTPGKKKDGVILNALDVQRSSSMRYLLSHDSSVISPTLYRVELSVSEKTDDAVPVTFDL
ncbi:unnamed protein product [Eruca vesicaria subsp. sativa]|uniref:C2 PI3K-type domain-containing protein n=1 Tax=Eruca vesicaria subsp. sativa TaxID=29727 RepID=A0ABC8KC90_ERUVS|nr:unnamed protein product [Eruca vesicaria subsp. sativa]